MIPSPASGRIARFALVAVLLPLPLVAQPSGGPYGPQRQRYTVPRGAAHVYYVAPDGSAEAAGTTLEQPTTIESAIERVVTGDAIVMRGGVYRTGGLRLNQGVTIQPYADEQPVLKGTRVAGEWRALRDNVWKTSWKTLFPMKPAAWWQRDREGMRTPLHRFNNDMVFVDGELLQSAGWPGGLDSHSFFVDYETGSVYLGADPKGHLVEITAFDSALVRTTNDVHGKKSDRKGPTIRGLSFTQYAYRALEVEGADPEGPADPATFGKDVVGTTLEDVTISFCSRVAAYLRGDRLTLRRCRVSDTSTEGVFVLSSSDVLLEKNVFLRNNVERITGYYPSAVKIFNQTHRVTCRDNYVAEQPYSNGIWYDVGNVDGVFVDNWIENAQDGFFFEISKGAICARNVFVGCDKGVRVLNSSNVRVYANTFVNTVASFERTERSAAGDHFGWHPATGPDVDQRHGHVFVDNVLAADAWFPKALLRVEQVKGLCGKLTDSPLVELDGNLYVRAAAAGAARPPLVVWSPAAGEGCTAELDSLEAFRALQPGFEKQGISLAEPLAAIFRSPELKRYELVAGLLRKPGSVPLPAAIRALLGWQKQQPGVPGAFPELP